MAAPEITILLGSRDHELALAKIVYFGGAVVLDAKVSINPNGDLWVAWGADYHLNDDTKAGLSARILQQYTVLAGQPRRPAPSLAQLAAKTAKAVVPGPAGGSGSYRSQTAPVYRK